jgi:hypothetical protein
MSNRRKGEPAIVLEFVATADEFCRLVESHRKSSRAVFLKRIYVLLARVFGLALQLPPAVPDEKFDEQPMTSDEWQALFLSLGKKLGPQNYYWEFFNPYVKNEPVAGSLADDLADIYGDLRPGLELYKQGSLGARRTAIWNWRFLLSHWGHHATDALRALQEIHRQWGLVE